MVAQASPCRIKDWKSLMRGLSYRHILARSVPVPSFAAICVILMLFASCSDAPLGTAPPTTPFVPRPNLSLSGAIGTSSVPVGNSRYPDGRVDMGDLGLRRTRCRSTRSP